MCKDTLGKMFVLKDCPGYDNVILFEKVEKESCKEVREMVRFKAFTHQVRHEKNSNHLDVNCSDQNSSHQQRHKFNTETRKNKFVEEF